MAQSQGTSPLPENPFVPPGPEWIRFENFMGGINTNSSREAIADQEMYWSNGFFPIGTNKLRTMWGIGDAIFTTDDLPLGTTIVFFDFYNIGATPYCFAVISDGSAWQINTVTNAVTEIMPPGTILNPSRQNVGISQWGSLYLLIVAGQTNGYWLWDGTTLYAAGATAPGGGTMPTGISGTSVETYQSRVFISNGASFSFSAPGSFTDFAAVDGGNTVPITDSFLRVGVTQLRQSNGFLYFIADSSVSYLSGINTAGGPPVVTTYTYQNADPEIGTPYAATVDVFSRNILFGNAFGAFVSYGGAIAKISENLDGVFNTVVNFGGLGLSACKAIVFGKRIWAILVPIIDPVTGQQENILFCWNGKVWFATLQDIPLIFVQHQEINSVITGFGTDGHSIFPLFQKPTSGFTKTVQSKLWDRPVGYQNVKGTNRIWGLLQYYSNVVSFFNVSIDNETSSSFVPLPAGPLPMNWTTDGATPMIWTIDGTTPMNWTIAGGGIVVLPAQEIAQNGNLLGFTIETNAADMVIISMMIQPEVLQYRG